MFSKWAHKIGYDYSAFITTTQLVCLLYTFICYDRMYISSSTQLTKVTKDNQFTGGTVIWMLIQLLVMLLDRFITILNLEGYSKKWDVSLILKFILQTAMVLLVHYMIVWYIPNKSTTGTTNGYCTVFYLLYCLYFLLSALQIRDGFDRMSRGFM